MIRRLALGLMVACAAAQLVSLTGSADSLGLDALGDSFLASSLAAASLVALVSLPRGWAAGALGAGVLLEIVFILILPRPQDPAAWIVARGAGLGLAALLLLAIYAVRSRDKIRSTAIDALALAGILPLFVVATGAALDLTSTLHPLTLDGPCLRADAILGQPSFVLGRWFGAWPLLGQICAIIYGELPLFVGALIVIERRRSGSWPSEILASFVALGACGYALYHLFPVAGPRFFVHGWPGATPIVDDSLAHASALAPIPRNCMPSLHTAWILLCAIYARRAPSWFRALTALWVVGTLAATLGLGLHYGVDLLAALPFLVGFLALWRRRPALTMAPVDWRRAGLAFGAVGSAIVLAGALHSDFGASGERVFAIEAMAGLALAYWFNQSSRAAGLVVILVAAALPAWTRLAPLLPGGAWGAAVLGAPIVLLPLALVPGLELAWASSLGALAAALLLPVLGRSATALVLSLPALAFALPGTVASATRTKSRPLIAVVTGAVTGAGALAAQASLSTIAGDDFLTTPLLVAGSLMALAIGLRVRKSWPVTVAVLSVAALVSVWAWRSAPVYLGGFDGYAAVRTLGPRAMVRLAIALWCCAPLAFAMGMLIAAADVIRSSFIGVGALAGAILASLLLPMTRPLSTTRASLAHAHARFFELSLDAAEFHTRESWQLVRERLDGTATVHLAPDRWTSDALRALVATASVEMPHLSVALDTDDARLIACASECAPPSGPHLGARELAQFVGPDAADRVASDDNLLLDEDLAHWPPASHGAGGSRAALRALAVP